MKASTQLSSCFFISFFFGSGGGGGKAGTGGGGGGTNFTLAMLGTGGGGGGFSTFLFWLKQIEEKLNSKTAVSEILFFITVILT
jgi:hypothetical protein